MQGLWCYSNGVRFFLLALVLFLTILVGVSRYQQSSLLKKEGDELLKYGQSAEAIGLYQKAKTVFPLRGDLDAAVAGAKLVEESNRDYGEVVDVFAELQQPPPLTGLTFPQLAPNEVFVPILMYHHIRINPRPGDRVWAILNVSPSQLDSQFSYLSGHNFHPISFGQLLDALDRKASLPENPIILSFDDGYRNFYEAAFPLLKKYHFKATEFVITGVVDLPSYLTWAEIAEMDKSGLVEFGAHTRHHPNLPELSSEAVVNEIAGSKADLEQRLHKTVDLFAYPYGSYNDFILRAVREAGFRAAASTIYGVNQNKDNLYLSPRIMVDGRFSLEELARRIQR